ncbi:recombinase family protein [Streptomyces sp. NPDC096311]|uniref:recombinase family protein n=1 Tax=Streptomyces sp. NPDC096311 TaxID=3366083 RepID=UPI0037F26C3B
MTGTRLIGYGRVRNDPADFHDQYTRLRDLGVAEEDIHWDRGRTGHLVSQEGLTDALASTRPGDTLVITALDRLAPSLEALEELTPQLIDREIRLSVGGLLLDPANEAGRSVFDTFLLVAACHTELAQQRGHDMREAFLDTLSRLGRTA